MTSIDIQPFLDKDGLLKIWPARKRRAQQLAVLAHLAESFEQDKKYREKEVNEILKSRMTYPDFVLIRRELYEAKLLDRTLDGREYWRVESLLRSASHQFACGAGPSVLILQTEQAGASNTLSNPSPRPSPFEGEREDAL